MGELKVLSLLRTEGTVTHSWEATWDGPVVEIAQGLVGRSVDVEYVSLSSPSAADAWVAKQAAARQGEGYVLPELHKAAAPTRARVARNRELEARILETPEDDDLYLVYADWLEAEGDPRGQLIAIDHQLARASARTELKRQRLRLLLDYNSHFLPPHEEREIEVTWRRGFFDQLTVNGLDQVRAALKHPSGAFVRGLEVRTAIDGSELATIVEELGTLPLLTKLDCTFTDGSPPASFWTRVPRLVHVCAYAPEVLTIGNTTQWETLELTDEWLEEEIRAAIAENKWPKLTKLTLNTDGLPDGDDQLRPFLEGRSTPALRELEIVGDDVSLALLKQPLIAQLSTLRLVDCSLDDEALGEILEAPLAHLELLDVRQNWFSETAVSSLKDVSKKVLFVPQHTDEFEEDEDEDEEEEDDWDDDPFEDSGFSADIVPAYEDDTDDEDDGNLAIDKTWERGVVGFDHDE